VYLLSIIKWEMSKKTFKKLTFNYNLQFNYRWHCYISEYFGAVAPLSVQLGWSQLHPALLGAFVLNTVSITRHYIYSTCQGLYYVRQCEIYKSL